LQPQGVQFLFPWACWQLPIQFFKKTGLMSILHGIALLLPFLFEHFPKIMCHIPNLLISLSIVLFRVTTVSWKLYPKSPTPGRFHYGHTLPPRTVAPHTYIFPATPQSPLLPVPRKCFPRPTNHLLLRHAY